MFAGGCFWCMESDFERLNGIEEVVSGYAGGHVENPTYKEVTAGTTGHLEVIKVSYNPKKISYKKLLEVFWVNIDPFDDQGQFCDKGEQYKAAIFYSTEKEKELAIESREKISRKFDQPVVTEILPYSKFYEAEEYHQDYYEKKSWRYSFYRGGCGRDDRLKEVWGKKAGGKK